MSTQSHPCAVTLDGEGLTIDEVVAVARGGKGVQPLSSAVAERMLQSASWVESIVQEDALTVYGVNTGFGPLATQRVRREDTRALSYNVVVGCGVGVGEPFSEDVVRATMLVRANSLAKGFSGVRPVVVNTIVQMLNAGVIPLVPSKGSVGASGDLAPLAHIAMVFCEPPPGIAEDSGLAFYQGELLPGREAMARAGIPRIILEAKEGLALTNGAAAIAGMACLAVRDAWNLVRNAEVALAMSLEALCGFTDAFDRRPHEVRGHLGQQESAYNVRRLTAGSGLVDRFPHQVQDAYSLRCAPQVLGAVRDALRYVTSVVSGEINAASDNPLIFVDLDRENKAISAGNFHGEPLALAMDFMGIAMAEVAGISERRVFKLTAPALNNGLPAMLAKDPGLHLGYMMPQYTAAALVSDSKTLAHPDSVDSIPTSADQEDHVSMGMNAARHTREILNNGESVVAIELLSAGQALDLRPQEWRRGRGTEAAYRFLRQHTRVVDQDRPLFRDIDRVRELVRSGAILAAVEAATDDGERPLL